MHLQENSPRRFFPLPVWARLSVLVLGIMITPSFGRLLGRWVGDVGVGAAVAAALFFALVVFTTVRAEGNRARAALEGLAGGAVVGALVWYFSR